MSNLTSEGLSDMLKQIGRLKATVAFYFLAEMGEEGRSKLPVYICNEDIETFVRSVGIVVTFLENNEEVYYCEIGNSFQKLQVVVVVS